MLSLLIFAINLETKWTELEYLQMVTILALTGVKLTGNLKLFFNVMSYSLCGFPFILPPNYLNFYGENFEESDYLPTIGFRSTSTIANLFLYFMIGLLIVFVFTLIKGISSIMEQNDVLKVYADRINKYYYIVICRVITRYLLIGWFLMCISSIYELKYNITTSFTGFSIIPTLILIFLVLFITFVLCYSLIFNDNQNDYAKCLKELVYNLSESKLKKQYTTFFVVHRTLIVLIMAVITKNLLVKLALLSLIQIVYIASLIVIYYPFTDPLPKIHKVYRETCILILFIIMLCFSNDSEFKIFVFEYLFLGALMGSSVLWIIIFYIQVWIVKRKLNKPVEIEEDRSSSVGSSNAIIQCMFKREDSHQSAVPNVGIYEETKEEKKVFDIEDNDKDNDRDISNNISSILFIRSDKKSRGSRTTLEDLKILDEYSMGEEN